ncbi:hypothetical protein P9112_008067 [Eukaryota sp. TZLM1-RC]
MSLSGAAKFREQGLQIAQNAIKLDHDQNYPAAHAEYMKAIDYLFSSLKFEKSDQFKVMLRDKISQFMDRAEQLKGAQRQPVADGGPTKKAKSGNSSNKNSSKPDNGDDEEDEDPDTAKLKGALDGAIVREKPNVKWDDVAGLELAKEALKEAVIMPMRFPHLFVGKRTPWKGILLYGPPGTGKSYLAKAVATEVDSTFFSISSSDLVSKWQGESERLIKQLFTLARENKPSIIFIDEIDSLCSARSDNESEASRRIKTEFLVQMQGVGNVSDGILILGATNIPWNLDSAVRRRFEKRVYIPLPEASARATMFGLHIGDTPHELKQEHFTHLGEKTEGFSGADINILVRDALYQPVRIVQSATHFKQMRGPDPNNPDEMVDDLWFPCSPVENGAQEMNMMDIPSDKLGVSKVTYNHFLKSISKIKPSVSQEDIDEHIKWTELFGSSDADSSPSYEEVGIDGLGGFNNVDHTRIFLLVNSVAWEVFRNCLPGCTEEDLHLAAHRKCAEELLSLGLVNGEVNDLVENGVTKYFLVGADPSSSSPGPAIKNLAVRKYPNGDYEIRIQVGLMFNVTLLQSAKQYSALNRMFNWTEVEKYRRQVNKICLELDGRISEGKYDVLKISEVNS